MGAKDWFICYADTDVASVLSRDPQLDREATEELVRRLFPDHDVVAIDDGTLGESANPADEDVFAAVWPGASIVCTVQAAQDRPSQLGAQFLKEGAGRTVYTHAMHSVVDWFAYAAWNPDGGLRRALSVSSNDEVIEDIGARLSFEERFWAGDFPATDDGDYPLPFHPLELSEAALEHLFGFVFEGHSGMRDSNLVDPFDVTLAGFRLNGRHRRGFFRR
jgi:hypothetical protein